MHHTNYKHQHTDTANNIKRRQVQNHKKKTITKKLEKTQQQLQQQLHIIMCHKEKYIIRVMIIITNTKARKLQREREKKRECL